MVRTQLAHQDDRERVYVLLGIMLIYNEMKQENHGFTTSQIMWGQNMNLPTDLIHTPGNVGKGNPNAYVKNLGKELREIRKRVAPFRVMWGEVVLLVEKYFLKTEF